MNGYWRLSGGRLNVLFHILSAGELSILVKNTVQYSDKLNHMIALKSSQSSTAD